MAEWNPGTYLRFADERSRPFFDLTTRVGAEKPGTVVDLGCGPGQLTASLVERWPAAQVLGVDSSPQMIDAAMPLSRENLAFRLGDVRTWSPAGPVDVVISNAMLQWVPGHRDLLPRLVEMLSPDGWLAFQVPGNFGEPSHRLLRELAADSRFAAATAAVEQPLSAEPEDYLADLMTLGCETEVWETTYLHVLSGADPVFEWISGTGARPILQALPDSQRQLFVAEYKEMLNDAYPARAFGTVLPFRRIFVVAKKAGGRQRTQRRTR